MAARRSKAKAKAKPAKAERKKKEPRQKKAEVRTVDAETVEAVETALSVEDAIVYTTAVLIIGALVLGFIASSAFPA